MSYFLLDNPPASRQFYPSRNGGLSGGVVIHTTEGAGGADSAEATARFIARRSDAGSYHCIVDSEPDSAVLLMPDDYTAFGVAASGYNSRCWQIAIAAPSAALVADSPHTLTEIDNMGREIVGFWRRNGFDPLESARFIGEGVKEQAGLAHHGDVQPWDRSDAWSRREDRWVFDALLVQAIERHAGGSVAPQPPTVPVPTPSQSVWRVGSRGDKVRAIQQVVGVPVDGIFGPQTEAAVRRWQANLRITADGVWGPQTEEATRNLFVFLANLPAVDEPAENRMFREAVEAARQKIVRRGASGGEVKLLQAVLGGKGFPLAVDGVFGPITERAVRDFQSQRGIAVDGIVGPQTWTALLD